MNSDPMVRFMVNSDIPLTRANYLELCWPDGVPEWTAELESQVPDFLRYGHDDNLDGVARDEVIELSYDALGRVLYIALDAFDPGEPRKQDGEWTAWPDKPKPKK